MGQSDCLAAKSLNTAAVRDAGRGCDDSLNEAGSSGTSRDRSGTPPALQTSPRCLMKPCFSAGGLTTAADDQNLLKCFYLQCFISDMEGGGMSDISLLACYSCIKVSF